MPYIQKMIAYFLTILTVVLTVNLSGPSECEDLVYSERCFDLFESEEFYVNIPNSFTQIMWPGSWCGNEPETYFFKDSSATSIETIKVSWQYFAEADVVYGVNVSARKYELRQISRQTGHSKIHEISDLANGMCRIGEGWGYEAEYSDKIKGCVTQYAGAFYNRNKDILYS